MKLYLHIGLPKTGSSALQSWLSRKSAELTKNGITYYDLVPGAKEGRISSGNGVEIVQWLDEACRRPSFDARKFESRFLEQYFGNNDQAIISSELLGKYPKSFLTKLKNFLSQNGVEVTVICYFRDVYDQIHSAYVQAIKRHGYFKTFPEFIEDNVDRTQFAAVQNWSDVFGDFRLIHYDKVRENMVLPFLELINYTGSDILTKMEKINRSLSPQEISLMKILNSIDSGFSQSISDALIYKEPDKEYWPQLDLVALQSISEKYSENVAFINSQFKTDIQVIDLNKVHQYSTPLDVSYDKVILEVIGILIEKINLQKDYIHSFKNKSV